MRVFEEIKQAIQKGFPFVAYKKPNSKQVKSFFQSDKEIYNTKEFKESGFVFAPFDNTASTILIPFEKSRRIEETIELSIDLRENKINKLPNLSEKEEHISLVEKGIGAIKTEDFRKVVLSRKEIIDLKDLDFDVISTFKKLLVYYPTAFCYFWYHPKVGLWMGATPETLLDVKNTKFTTMSLAGTRVFTEEQDAEWGEKELDEQQLVTDYIANNLKEESTRLALENLETYKIGNLLHLRTKITGEFKTDITQILKVLHPTPAVCGFPTNRAKPFIIENEGYNREFYTGFLGELNLKSEEHQKESSLYVNLRCMQIQNEKAMLYIGGGITRGSNPEHEWEETIAKSMAMKKVL